MRPLFEPGGQHWGAASQKLRMTEAQRLRAALNAEKAKAPDCSGISVDESVLRHEGQTYLLPLDFVEAVKNGTIKRVGANPQELLEHIDGPLEEKALNYDHSTSPIYWLHIPGGGSAVAWPVYGYGADYGKGYHVTPMISGELPGWDTAEWLCRCAQCGRELPPSHFFLNTSGRLKGICRPCTSTDNIVDRIFKKPMRYRSEEESQLLVDTRHWYEALWRRNLCPRGNYANWCIGEADIQERMRLATRHKRGSAPRHPSATSPTKIHAIYDLMDDSQKCV